MNINQALCDPKVVNVISYNVRKFGWAFDTVDDAKQEAYLCLLEILDKFDKDNGCKLPTYLSVCLRRRFMGMCVKRKKYGGLAELHDIHEGRAEVPYGQNSLDDYGFLSEKQRKILYLYFFEEKTLAEISSEYGISIEWARILINQAKTIIRETV